VFDAICKACQQINRNDAKNTNRPLALIKNRAHARAKMYGESTQFFMVRMNWRALVPDMRGAMSAEGLCKSCGHAFLNERDIQIDHIDPPPSTPSRVDWAAYEHARNIRLLCASCNNLKGAKANTRFLEEQNAARISNEQHQWFADDSDAGADEKVDDADDAQLSLFDDEFDDES